MSGGVKDTERLGAVPLFDIMKAKEKHYLRGWVSALAAAVWQGDLQTHLARPILLSVGTEAEICRYADSGDVEILIEKDVLSND